MPRLQRLVVPALALALVLGTTLSAAAQSPIQTVPLHISGKVLSCYSVGGCAYRLTTRHEDGAPQTFELAQTEDGVLQAPDGPVGVPTGTLNLAVEVWALSDVMTDGARESASVLAGCDHELEVPPDPRGLELTLVASHRGCLLEVVASQRNGPDDPPTPASLLTSLHALPTDLDPVLAHPPLLTVTPQPAPLPPEGIVFRTALGHCGLFSPVDIGGSFWDPVGVLDSAMAPVDTEAERSELINATEVQAVRVGEDRLDMRTPLATVIVLARHEGPSEYPGCD